MVGLKVRMEIAESELERLKRKRTDSVSPERVITGILKRPATADSMDRSPPTGKEVPSSSAQLTPKKSRTRKDRWNDVPTSSAPPTSSNRNGLKGRNDSGSQPKKRDPVLYNSPSSFRKKQDIIKEIAESAKTLSLSRSDTSLVFCRLSVEDQVTVTKKALAYVELLITSTCVHMLKSAKITGNPVQAYLNTLSLAQVVALQKEVDEALEQSEDSTRHMAVYRGGDNLASRVRMQCFTKDWTPLRPHKLNDMLQRLHERLGYHSQHSITIGFYYAKWSEKLHFHLTKAGKQDHSLSTTSRTRTPTPTPAEAPSPPKFSALEITSSSAEAPAYRQMPRTLSLSSTSTL
jgi:hypothetical protein